MSVGSFEEGLWGSVPPPDDAEALLGAFVQSPIIAALAVLFLAIALVLVRAGAAPSLSELAQARHLVSSAPIQLSVSSPSTVSRAPKLRVQRTYTELPYGFTRNKGQTDERVRSHAQGVGFSVHGKRSQPVDLHLLDRKSNTSLERGPPQPGMVNRLAASDRTSWHARHRTYRELRHRDAWPRVEMVLPAQALATITEFPLPTAKQQVLKALEIVVAHESRGTPQTSTAMVTLKTPSQRRRHR